MKKDKLLYFTPWLSLYQTDKGFIYSERKNIDSVAVLCYRITNNQREFLVHFQPLPEIKEKQKWDDCFPSPITGGLEQNETYLQTAIRETFEEAGIKVTEKNLVKSFRMLATTQSNEIVCGFIFDVTNLKQVEPSTDGSVFEKVSYNKWYSEKEFKEIVKNELTIASLAYLYYKLIED
ncbi:NUDIX domain-containing protein [Mycoplasma zalophi]|uniref:NUDIX domain-containing protein n=1 Tax=Mycoplasma zalophi TaxID=191287 RepID=A0ABS6DQJ1_9MOLU|nr:NUDIX domain-containing protein [Mycoplasma zalophi]MBU4691190.1 NUDIX domain-containing protein [Mycoplasma zalophi]MBU4692036.1 NUDIX domain-containing protein [Mycoplasma zalophi]